jgi:O-antigen chain-terminating methyltransferase
MSGDEHAAPNADPSRGGGDQGNTGGLHRLMKAFFDLTPWGMRRLIDRQSKTTERFIREIFEPTIDRVEARLDAAEEALRSVQTELAELRSTQFASAEARLDAAEKSLTTVVAETGRLRDDVVPAVVGRSDALLERLAAELEELGSLVERVLRKEPLPAPGEGALDENRLSDALAEVQPVLLEAFRGPEDEIQHRLDRYLDALRLAPPVLDLGSGRGELLLLLREAGIEAAGVEGDLAVAQAALRRGLDVTQGDVLEVLRTLPDASRGAVTAIHLFEHLESATLLAVLAEIRRVLRPGGVLIAESPNPHTLRVGAALYWADPTHRRPLLPETLEVYLATSGFEVDRREMLHPFPDEQLFAAVAPDTGASENPDVAMLTERVNQLGRRLDELVNGPRDFAVWASRP